jgi:hypothetical protein
VITICIRPPELALSIRQEGSQSFPSENTAVKAVSFQIEVALQPHCVSTNTLKTLYVLAHFPVGFSLRPGSKNLSTTESRDPKFDFPFLP